MTPSQTQYTYSLRINCQSVYVKQLHNLFRTTISRVLRSTRNDMIQSIYRPKRCSRTTLNWTSTAQELTTGDPSNWNNQSIQEERYYSKAFKYLFQLPYGGDINHAFHVYSCILRHQEVFQEPSKTLQKGVWEGVQNAVLRGPQTGIYRVLQGCSIQAAQYPVICHVVCTPGPSAHGYPTVATCNDTSRHYIRVYTCVYT